MNVRRGDNEFDAKRGWSKVPPPPPPPSRDDPSVGIGGLEGWAFVWYMVATVSLFCAIGVGAMFDGAPEFGAALIIGTLGGVAMFAAIWRFGK